MQTKNPLLFFGNMRFSTHRMAIKWHETKRRIDPSHTHKCIILHFIAITFFLLFCPLYCALIMSLSLSTNVFLFYHIHLFHSHSHSHFRTSVRHTMRLKKEARTHSIPTFTHNTAQNIVNSIRIRNDGKATPKMNTKKPAHKMYIVRNVAVYRSAKS